MIPRRSNKFIDTRLPLAWVISSVAAIIVTLVGVAIQFNNQSTVINSKMDALLASFAEQKVLNKERDSKYDLLREQTYATQRLVDAYDLRISALERIALQQSTAAARK